MPGRLPQTVTGPCLEQRIRRNLPLQVRLSMMRAACFFVFLRIWVQAGNSLLRAPQVRLAVSPPGPDASRAAFQIYSVIEQCDGTCWFIDTHLKDGRRPCRGGCSSERRHIRWLRPSLLASVDTSSREGLEVDCARATAGHRADAQVDNWTTPNLQ
jgi:hypothetical protein